MTNTTDTRPAGFTYPFDGFVSSDLRVVSTSRVRSSKTLCTSYADCGCCECFNTAAIKVVSEYARYSRSQKAWVVETVTEYLCTECAN